VDEAGKRRGWLLKLRRSRLTVTAATSQRLDEFDSSNRRRCRLTRLVLVTTHAHLLLVSADFNCRLRSLCTVYGHNNDNFSLACNLLKLERRNPWPHVANRHMSISQLLSSCCYLFTVSNSGLLSVLRPCSASHAHFRHRHLSVTDTL